MLEDNGRINRMRLEVLEKGFEEMKKEHAAERKRHNETRETLASIRTEQRIIGGLNILTIGTLIAIALAQVFTS